MITQLFYDNEDFFRFRDSCAALGIRVPIIPGVLPVTNLAQSAASPACAARLPETFVADLEANDDSAADQFEVGVDFATAQVQALLDSGVPGIHFYVLNKSTATCRVLRGVTRPA